MVKELFERTILILTRNKIIVELCNTIPVFNEQETHNTFELTVTYISNVSKKISDGPRWFE